MPWPVQSLAQSLSQSLAQSLSGAGKVFIPMNTLVFTRGSEAYLRYNEQITHFSNPHQKAYRTVAGVPLILIEEAKTNQLNQPSNHYEQWSLQAKLDITDNSVTAPDGTTTASEIVPTTENGGHNFYGAINNIVSGNYYTFELWAKGNEHDWIAVTMESQKFPVGGSVYFDITNGVVGTETNGWTGEIIAEQNGWYRCIVHSLQADASGGNGMYIFIAEGDGDNVFAGDGTSGVYFWHSKFEEGVYPTSIIRNKNLITYSDRYTAATTDWSNVACTIDEASLLVSDNIFADKIVENSATAVHYINQGSISVTANTTYMCSFKAKKGERSWINAEITDPSLTFGGYYDLENGAVGTASGGAILGITDIGNDEYRCTMQITTGGTAGSADISLAPATGDGGKSYLGDGSSGLYVWRAQFEAGDGATDPQYTGSTLDTRVAAQAYWASADVPSWVYTGKFKILWVPNGDHDEYASDVVLLHPSGNAAMLLKYDIGDGKFQLTDLATGTCVESAAATFTKNNLIEIMGDYDNAEMTIAGADTGNGTTSGTAWSWSGDLYLGTDLTDYCNGLISPPIKA